MNALRVPSTLAIIAMASWLCSCSTSLQVKTDVDQSADFSKYTSFDFYQIEEEKEKMNELTKRRVLMAIEQELGRKGIKKSGSPDLIINIYTLVSSTEGRVVHNPGGMRTSVGLGGYGGYYGGYGSSFGVSYSAPSSSYIKGYRKGQYIVDLVDRENMQLVLQSVVYSEAEEGNKDQERRINYAVRKMFADIPDVK